MSSDQQKIFLLGSDSFTMHIDKCLKESSLETNLNSILTDDPFDIVIVTLFKLDDKKEEEIDNIIKSRAKKIILVENGLELYLNSKNDLPFSVYSKVIPKNDICRRYLNIEQKIIKSKKQYVIFRVSEIYGQSIYDSLVERLLFATSGEFENSTRDFIYDGDVISAIEIALINKVTGIFDIASGNSIDLRDLANLIKKFRQDTFDITWKKKKQKVIFNCENFKFYKWEPIVSLEVGIKTLLTLRRKHVDSQRTRNCRQKDF